MEDDLSAMDQPAPVLDDDADEDDDDEEEDDDDSLSGETSSDTEEMMCMYCSCLFEGEYVFNKHLKFCKK